MSGYAAETQVPIDRSRTEIEKVLKRFGADQFVYGWDQERAFVQFRANERVVRFLLSMPVANDPDIEFTPTGQLRSPSSVRTALDKKARASWRALTLIIKAKLVAIDSGITEFESEFLAHIVLPSGETVGGWILPQIEKAYELGSMPLALPIGDSDG